MATHHAEEIIHANVIDICTDSYGDRNDPAILLIMGASASMILWTENFCQRLADAARFVIRFDNRDVGRTTCCPLGEPNYSMHDMADDAVAVLDHYGIDQAHICGASMGGMITQLVGLNHPERVLSLTPIMSSPDPGAVTDAMEGKETRYALSPPSEAVIAAAMSGGTLDWSDRLAVIDNRASMFEILSGSAHPYDAPSQRALFAQEFDRANNIASSQNHASVVGTTERWHERLESINVPTLVIHGTEDPILPFDHGQAIADSIPGAKLLTLNGVGHELPEGELDSVIPAIIEITS
jgi:pimeloyl-ACP methyl ester carboxylesterase